MKLVIAGQVRVNPARRDEAVQVALRMARATRSEPGCIQYRFSADLEDPSVFCIFEEWQDEEALSSHFASAHMRDFQQALPGLVAGAPEIKRYTVASDAPL